MSDNNKIVCVTTAQSGGGIPYLEINAVYIPHPPVVRGSLVLVFLTVTMRADSEYLLFSHWIPDPMAQIYEADPKFRIIKAISDARNRDVYLKIPPQCTWEYIVSALDTLEVEVRMGKQLANV